MPSYTANKSLSPKLAWMNNSRIRLDFKGSCLKQEGKAPYTPSNVVDLYLFTGNVKITKNGYPDKYSYSGYGVDFDSFSLFSIPIFDWGKNAIIFGVDISLSVHIDNKHKDILVLGKGPT